jgi:hypothetical protein
MSQPRFEALRERLLRAGIAARHVRRYVGELRDHFDDLVRDEIARGATRSVAESNARARLGNEDALAEVMLARPGTRAIAARYPWAVFGIAPAVLVFAAVFGAVLIEAAIFKTVQMFVPHPVAAQRETMISVIAVWNWFATTAAPLVIAAALCGIGLRQRIAPRWIFAGIAIACILGAFQALNWTDDGHHGELSLGSGFLPPYPTKLIIGGLYRAVVTLALAATIYWWGARRYHSDAATSEQAATLAAE